MLYYDVLLSEFHELGAAVDVNGGDNTLPVEIGATSVFSRNGRQIAVTCKRQHIDASGTPRHYLYTIAVDGVSVDAKNDKCARDEWTSPQVKDLLGWRKYTTGKGNTGGGALSRGIRVDMTHEQVSEYCAKELTTIVNAYNERINAAVAAVQKSVAHVTGQNVDEVDVPTVLNIHLDDDDETTRYTYLPTFIDLLEARLKVARANSASAREAKKLDNVDVAKLDEGTQDAMMIRLLVARGMTEDAARAAVAGLAAPAAPATTDDTTTAK